MSFPPLKSDARTNIVFSVSKRQVAKFSCDMFVSDPLSNVMLELRVRTNRGCEFCSWCSVCSVSYISRFVQTIIYSDDEETNHKFFDDQKIIYSNFFLEDQSLIVLLFLSCKLMRKALTRLYVFQVLSIYH